MRENNSDHAAQPKKAGEVSAKPSKKAGIFARLSNGSRRHEHEFLPAALEILETPPSPVGRTTALLLCALFVIALTWSIVGQIEINATAQAQIVPIGGVKTLQSLETAVVRRILVDDGQFVKKGDLLVELDSTESMTDLSQLQNQLDRARKDATRYAAFLSALGVELEEYNSGTENNNDEINHPEKLPRGLKHNAIFIDSGKQPHADIEQSKNISLDQKRLLVAELIAYQSKSAALEAQISESDAIIRSSSHEYQKHRDRLKLLETKADALKKMVERHGTAKLQWLEAEQERSATRDSMSIEREHALQTKASRARVQSELKQYQADIQRDVLAKWIEARDTTLKNELDIARYRERERHRYLRAPADGTIQELKTRAENPHGRGRGSTSPTTFDDRARERQVSCRRENSQSRCRVCPAGAARSSKNR